MFDRLATSWFHLLGQPCFRVYGKARSERDWRMVEVHATRRRDHDSAWPPFLWRGTCITWTSQVIAVGWDFAEELLLEQAEEPASRDHPVEVLGGRLHGPQRLDQRPIQPWPSASEILAHECGHTYQARRLGLLYWPVGGAVTLFREGPHWYNHFENRASEQGLFGGIVNGSVCPALMNRLRRPESPKGPS